MPEQEFPYSAPTPEVPDPPAEEATPEQAVSSRAEQVAFSLEGVQQTASADEQSSNQVVDEPSSTIEISSSSNNQALLLRALELIETSQKQQADLTTPQLTGIATGVTAARVDAAVV